ncbi:DNA repair protein RecN [Candidatus Marifrigoribacter sp. Uisw_064]|uniref:DNA repair protein RecN n=1 Tax=Candidatus Marifrigoribacter sp. Uisw_064 TaxID=3230970 RepID=UPI003D457747
MITQLSIKNYALIDDINVDFTSGLTIITGETGAGKSILLGALSLLLGKRAELSSINDTSKKCIIEASFSIKRLKIQNVFEKNTMDYDPETILRRELFPNGKSRAFVNDSPVTLQQLQSLAPYLVDIHTQHETLTLFSENFQMEVIDVLANNENLLQSYSHELKEYFNLTETISELKYKKESANKELDYNTFLYNEIEQAKLKGVNLQSLEESFETLNNTESIQEVFSKAMQLFSEEHIGTIETAKEIRNALSTIKSYAAEYESFWERLNSCVIELEDLQESIHDATSNVEANPELLFETNNALQAIYKLQQKHAVATIDELLEIQNTLKSQIDSTLNLDEKINDLEVRQKKLHQKLTQLGTKISLTRSEAIPILKKKMEHILNQLGLPNARFKFELSKSTSFKKNGTDTLALLFTANKGLDYAPLKKVASGGELSRIMLAIKSVLASYKKLPTLIFDEIDTGVSGEVATKMALILETMSDKLQLICITHLPQLAGKGNNHLKIYKEDHNNLTVTRLRNLNAEERIEEIAEMIGGKEKSETAILHAKELLN